MGAGNYSKLVTVLTGQVITADERNNEHDNHINNHDFAGLDDYSTSLSEMRTQTDPFPASSPSQPTSGAGEMARIRYQLHQILNALYPSKTYWYEDVVSAVGKKGADIASAAALAPGTDGNMFDVTGTTAITSIATVGVGAVIHLQFDGTLILTHHSSDLILPHGKSIQTKAGDVATFLEYASGDWICLNYSPARADYLAGYRRPNLLFFDTAKVTIEPNTKEGTNNKTEILFPDGDLRSAEEDVGAGSGQYRIFDITATAEFASGTLDSGLRSGISEATDTWYAIYAVKVTKAGDTDKFVLAGDTTLPTRGNVSTLNSRYGTYGWVYLGMIRNGDASGATGNILAFEQQGNFTSFGNTCAGGSEAGTGIRMAVSASTATLTYTYAAGTGAAQIPDNIQTVNWLCIQSSGTAPFTVRDAASAQVWGRMGTLGDSIAMEACGKQASLGVRNTGGSAVARDTFLTGFWDTALGIAGNPIY